MYLVLVLLILFGVYFCFSSFWPVFMGLYFSVVLMAFKGHYCWSLVHFFILFSFIYCLESKNLSEFSVLGFLGVYFCFVSSLSFCMELYFFLSCPNGIEKENIVNYSNILMSFFLSCPSGIEKGNIVNYSNILKLVLFS